MSDTHERLANLIVALGEHMQAINAAHEAVNGCLAEASRLLELAQSDLQADLDDGVHALAARVTALGERVPAQPHAADN